MLVFYLQLFSYQVHSGTETLESLVNLNPLLLLSRQRPKSNKMEFDHIFYPKIQLQLPGIPKEHIDITIERDQINISGERNIEKNEEGKKFNSIESHFGTFRRSFTLPENIDKDKIKANHTHGILIIEIPKDMKKMIKKSIAIS